MLLTQPTASDTAQASTMQLLQLSILDSALAGTTPLTQLTASDTAQASMTQLLQLLVSDSAQAGTIPLTEPTVSDTGNVIAAALGLGSCPGWHDTIDSAHCL